MILSAGRTLDDGMVTGTVVADSQFQILNPIIISDSVEVVNTLIGCEPPSKVCGHDKAMLMNATTPSLPYHGMITRNTNSYISLIIGVFHQTIQERKNVLWGLIDTLPFFQANCVLSGITNGLSSTTTVLTKRGSTYAFIVRLHLPFNTTSRAGNKDAARIEVGRPTAITNCLPSLAIYDQYSAFAEGVHGQSPWTHHSVIQGVCQ